MNPASNDWMVANGVYKRRRIFGPEDEHSTISRADCMNYSLLPQHFEKIARQFGVQPRDDSYSYSFDHRNESDENDETMKNEAVEDVIDEVMVKGEPDDINELIEKVRETCGDGVMSYIVLALISLICIVFSVCVLCLGGVLLLIAFVFVKLAEWMQIDENRFVLRFRAGVQRFLENLIS